MTARAVLVALLLALSAAPADAYRSPWRRDLRQEERAAADWARHCGAMRARVQAPFGCRR